MARARATDSKPLDQEKAMTAMVALLAAERVERLGEAKGEPRDTVLVLRAAGLEAAEIFPLVGKTYDAVQKTIQRSPKKPAVKKRGS